MAQSRTARSSRERGSIDQLPSGALRVRVYAGVDPVTKRRHDLVEVIPPGPQAERKARAARDRLVSQVAEKRNPRTSATVDQLLERYLDQFDGAPNTLTLYRGYVRNHISPFLGQLKVGQLDAEALDAFYAELRRCRKHCTGKRVIDHRTASLHECDHRCGPLNRPEFARGWVQATSPRWAMVSLYMSSRSMWGVLRILDRDSRTREDLSHARAASEVQPSVSG